VIKFSQDNKLLQFDKTIQQLRKHQMISTLDQETHNCLHESKIKQERYSKVQNINLNFKKIREEKRKDMLSQDRA